MNEETIHFCETVEEGWRPCPPDLCEAARLVGIVQRDSESVWREVHHRVLWWITDMAYKPQELLNGARGVHYFECMAQDIADTAAGVEFGTLTAMDRLDPPKTPRAGVESRPEEV